MKHLTIYLTILFLLVVAVDVNAEKEISQGEILTKLINDSFWMSSLIEAWGKDDINNEQMHWFAEDYGAEADKIYWKIVDSNFDMLLKTLIRYRLAILNVELDLEEDPEVKPDLEDPHQTIREASSMFYQLQLINEAN